MKKLLLFTLTFFVATFSIAQEVDADDRVNITQVNKPFIGVYAFGYQGSPNPGYPQFQLNNYGGVDGTPAATADNSILGMFAFSGHNGNAKKTVGIIRVKSMDNFAANLSSRMDFLIGPNREQRLTILGDSGNVGIGENNPQTALYVKKENPMGQPIIAMESGDNNSYMIFNNIIGTMGYTGVIDDSNDMVLGGTNNVKFLTGNPGFTRMTILNNGNVGIGTQTPLAPLSVESSNPEMLTLNSNSGNDNYVSFYVNGGNSKGYIGIYNGDNDMDIGTDLYNTSGKTHLVTGATPRLTVDSMGLVGIGTTNPIYKLEVVDTVDAGFTSFYIMNNRLSSSTNVIRAKYTAIGNIDATAIEAESTPADGYGFGLNAEGGFVGVYSIGDGGAYTSSVYGVYGLATGTEGTRYAVYGNSGGAGNATSYAGYFSGDATVTGTFNNPSDRKLKKDIEGLEDALDIINQLEAKTYMFNNVKYANMNLPKKEQIGFIAQEVEEILPQLISEQIHPSDEIGPDGHLIKSDKEDLHYKAINYQGLIPVLTQGIKELTADVEEKDEKIVELTEKMESLEEMMLEMQAQMQNLQKGNAVESSSKQQNQNTNVFLNGSDMPVLEQNSPNPFYEQTTIQYYLPNTSKNATLTITDINGSTLKVVKLSHTGFGNVTIHANELPIGTYAYTLTVDGRRVASKQMVLVK